MSDLRPCDPQTVVIFGASGDLTERMVIPALYDLFVDGLLTERFAVIGYSRSKFSDDEFRSKIRGGIESHARNALDDHWGLFSERLRYVAGDIDTEGAMHHLIDHLEEVGERFGCKENRLFYLATPPDAFPLVVQRIGEEGLAPNSKIIVEKPFGEDLESARELNERLHEVFDENRIFRIDHYLGKETVQNILAFRFSNGMFEPLWNRRHVSYAELSVAEDIGIGTRGSFYESMGAIRDIAQNHLLQLLALLAMEPPVAFDAEAIRDEKTKLLRSVHPVDPSAVVRGQYGPGEVDGDKVVAYRQEEDVEEASTTETYVAMKLRIDNWRWAGVPFLLRTGKRLKRRATEITVVFHDAPTLLFEQAGLAPPDPNHLTLRIQPDEGICLVFDAKEPGPEMKVVPVQMDFRYEDSFMSPPAKAYERLLYEAMEGDQTLFTRADEIERSWEIVAPALGEAAPEEYPAGSWGPKGADDLILPGRWHLS